MMSEQKHQVVIVGAGYAGLTAALWLANRTRRPNILLINASDQFVERIRLHQFVSEASSESSQSSG